MERRLTANHPAMVSLWDNAGNKWATMNGWQMVDGNTGACFHETVIDLSGYSMDSLTFFPAAIGLQDPGVYQFKPVVDPTFPIIGVIMLDIVTSVPMDMKELVTKATTSSNIGPGLIGSLYEFETILFGMFRFFTSNSQIPFPNYMQLERSQRFDSGEPTAADKLYCYRVALPLQQDLADGNYLGIPAARQLIGGAIGEESELVYMQRLKRSYELANQVVGTPD